MKNTTTKLRVVAGNKAVKADTVTLKHLATALAESHSVPKAQMNTILTDMVASGGQAPQEGLADSDCGAWHIAGAQARGAYGSQHRQPAKPSRSKPARDMVGIRGAAGRSASPLARALWTGVRGQGPQEAV